MEKENRRLRTKVFEKNADANNNKHNSTSDLDRTSKTCCEAGAYHDTCK